MQILGVECEIIDTLPHMSPDAYALTIISTQTCLPERTYQYQTLNKIFKRLFEARAYGSIIRN